MLEYGWGGKDVTPGNWTPTEVTVGPSLWGHDRAWLPAEQFQRAREMRLKAAADGMRQPLHVIDGNLRPARWCLPLVGRGHRARIKSRRYFSACRVQFF